jgi:hypothetical protein
MASRLPEVEVYTPQVVPSQPLQSAQPSQPTQPTQIPIADTVDVSI